MQLSIRIYLFLVSVVNSVNMVKFFYRLKMKLSRLEFDSV